MLRISMGLSTVIQENQIELKIAIIYRNTILLLNLTQSPRFNAILAIILPFDER